MTVIKHLRGRSLWAGVGTVAAGSALAVSLSLTAASAAPATTAVAASSHSFSFALVPSPGIHACLPHAGGRVTITPGSENDLMQVSVFGMPRNAEFDLFVIQQPGKPFGVSWYQTDVDTNVNGVGSASVRGIFDRETFSVSPGGTTTFPPTHQYHLGLWFNDPKLPFKLGCEPTASAPVVTPFNGEQHAGI
ncbi:MAG TPA: hypothetical protein VKU77_02800, partial [Streptosporangiaceae bacterium]|nr:hypothetical protein [Streptosporangiaceae bacterium]